METGEVVSCTDDDVGRPSIRDGLDLLSKAERLYGHNVIYFDIPAIQKVYPEWTYRGRVMDTLIAARFWKSDIAGTDWGRVRKKMLPAKLVGSHSLKAWGYRLGVLKGEFNENADWSKWTPDMQTYCEQDTAVTRALVTLLRKAKLSPEAMETEHELAFFLAAMERNGFPLNMEECERLQGVLSARRAQLDHELRDVFGSWIVGGAEFVPKRPNKKLGYYTGCPATKVKIVQFNPASRDHIVQRLKALYGWTPTEFTENGTPKMDDEVMGALPYPEAPKLAEYLLVQKRLGQMAEGKQAWMKLARKHPVTGMHHVHGSINQLGAVTHRATHRNPNMSQVPSAKADKDHNLIFGKDSDYSTDFRNVWTVPEGWVIVGADASGLELRNLAHYMARYDGGAYVDVVLNGDIHTVNQKAAGLPTRAEAKTFIYAFLYGEGDEARGAKFLPATATSEEKIAKGKSVRTKFLKGLPALSKLIDKCKEIAADVGYFTVLDGRRISVRHEHAALNSLLQSAGAVICKRWLVEANRKLRARYGEQGWMQRRIRNAANTVNLPYLGSSVPDGWYVYDAPGQWAALVWSHDEVQIACRPEIAEEVAAILVETIRSMTQHFAFRCPLDGEAKIGRTWAQTH